MSEEQKTVLESPCILVNYTASKIGPLSFRTGL